MFFLFFFQYILLFTRCNLVMKWYHQITTKNLSNITFLLGCNFKCYDNWPSNFITIFTIMQIKVEQHLASKYILLGTCFFLLFSSCFKIIGSQKYHPEIQKIWPMTWIFYRGHARPLERTFLDWIRHIAALFNFMNFHRQDVYLWQCQQWCYPSSIINCNVNWDYILY